MLYIFFFFSKILFKTSFHYFFKILFLTYPLLDIQSLIISSSFLFGRYVFSVLCFAFGELVLSCSPLTVSCAHESRFHTKHASERTVGTFGGGSVVRWCSVYFFALTVVAAAVVASSSSSVF